MFQQRTTLVCAVLFVCLLNPGALRAAENGFSVPICITASLHAQEQSAADPYYLLDNYRMSRNPGRQAAFDTSGTLHLAYWSGFLQTLPESPAIVYYQSWSPESGWTPQVTLDQSFSSEAGYIGQRMGGRQPSLAVGPDDRVWVFWQDTRNCLIASPSNGIDNFEIYGDSKARGGNFSSSDIRLTDTSAAHYGDNGYAPQVAIAPDGKVSVIWYDFHETGGVSDIYMMTSDASGDFNLATPMLDRRLTQASDRGALPPLFTMPDLAIGPAGQRYAIWTEGTGGSFTSDTGAPIHFALPGEQPAILNYSTPASDSISFWNPARIRLSPMGDLYIVYTVEDNIGTAYAWLLEWPAGEAGFQPARQLGPGKNPDLAIDAQGNLHFVFVEEGGYLTDLIQYRLVSGVDGSLLAEAQITPAQGSWTHPCITLDPEGAPHILFAEYKGENPGAQGDIWFSRALKPETNAQYWTLY